MATAGCAERADPNSFSVLLVTLDTTRADRIGAFGGTAVPTPNLDRVAREGAIFTSAISQVPLTLPAHSSILTGRYPAAHGVRHNGLYRLPDAEVTLAERLADAGLSTAAFIGAFVLNAHYGTAQGFGTYVDIAAHRYEGGRDNLYEAQRTAEEVNEQFFAWLDKRPPGRFFAWVHYYDPHLPYAPPESPGRVLHGKGYDREISYMDSCFGDLVERLRRDGLLDSTLLVIAGDHGESLGEHRELTHGVFLYEGAVRVPFILRAPGLVPAGRTVEGPVELVDIAPTVLDLLGLEGLQAAQGRSLVPTLRGSDDDLDGLAFAETFMPRIEFGWSELLMVRDDRYKYIQAPRPELYDLHEDPKELNNLIDAEAELAGELAAELTSWLVAATDPEGAARSRKTLTADEEARLLSLGYLGGGRFGTEGDGSALPDPKDHIDEGRLLTVARDQLAAGQIGPALEIVERTLAENPRNHLAHTTRLQALVRLGRLDDAVEQAQAGLEATVLDGASPMREEQAQRALASVLWMVGRNSEAEGHYRQALELAVKNGSAPVFGGLLLGAAAGREEAMHIVRQVLERNPGDPMALAARFELELAQGETDAAVATARLLAEHRAGDADTLTRAGILMRDRGEPKLALALFEIAAERAPEDPDLLGHIGTLRLGLGHLDRAAAAFEAVRRLRPADPRACLYLGNIALLRNDEAGARAHYDAALAIDPGFTPPLVNLARWLAEKGRVAEALTVLDDALRRTPDNEDARRVRAQLGRQGGTPPAG